MATKHTSGLIEIDAPGQELLQINAIEVNADRVIAMDSYLPRDVTAEAQAIAATHRDERRREGSAAFGPLSDRVPLPDSVNPGRGRKRIKVQVRGLRQIRFGREDIDLAAVEQLVDRSQTRAIAYALVYAWQHYLDGARTVPELVDRVLADVENEGLDVLAPYLVGDLAAFRRFELSAALNRLRTLEVRGPVST